MWCPPCGIAIASADGRFPIFTLNTYTVSGGVHGPYFLYFGIQDAWLVQVLECPKRTYIQPRPMINSRERELFFVAQVEVDDASYKEDSQLVSKPKRTWIHQYVPIHSDALASKLSIWMQPPYLILDLKLPQAMRSLLWTTQPSLLRLESSIDSRSHASLLT